MLTCHLVSSCRFVHICQKFIEEQSLDMDQFAMDFLPSLLDLSLDPIPNVRITLARTLAQSVMPLGKWTFFSTLDGNKIILFGIDSIDFLRLFLKWRVIDDW